MIVSPIKLNIDVCFECECGCIHWLEYKYVKQGYEIECYCGKVLRIKPTVINTSIGQNNPIISNPIVKNDNLIRVKKILVAQGFSLSNINFAISQLSKVNGSKEYLLKEILTLL